uniref:Uncharacterized protein n=1 Tax=Arundo donax TaxID=35708 RepID=A0A0A9BKE9_ARUDO
MWLARFGCRRRPMYRLMAAGCRFPRSSNSFELFRDRSAVKFPSPDADLDDNVSMPPKNQVAVAYFQDPPSVVKTCLALDTKTVVPLNAIVGSVSSVQPVGLSRDIFSDNAITRTSDTVTADLISQLKSSKHCGVGHGPGAGQSIFSRNLCGFPEQGENSKLPLCDDHNTQIEPPLDECKKYEIKTGNSKLLVEKIEEAIEENNRILDKSLLQKRFDLGMKPVLAPRLLLLPKDISDPSTRFLRDQYFLTNDKEAHFLSSYELTIHEKRIDDPEEWDRFMNNQPPSVCSRGLGIQCRQHRDKLLLLWH